MTIRFFLFVCLIFTLNSVHAQKVKLKKDIVYVDGEATFSYAKKTQGTELVIYALNTKDELLTAIFYPGNKEIRDDNYYKIVFTSENKSLEYTRAYWGKSLIKWLLEQEVLNAESGINSEKIDGFISKYDEKVLERRMILR